MKLLVGLARTAFACSSAVVAISPREAIETIVVGVVLGAAHAVS